MKFINTLVGKALLKGAKKLVELEKQELQRVISSQKEIAQEAAIEAITPSNENKVQLVKRDQNNSAKQQNQNGNRRFQNHGYSSQKSKEVQQKTKA
jgi:hypothetical protein